LSHRGHRGHREQHLFSPCSLCPRWLIAVAVVVARPARDARITHRCPPRIKKRQETECTETADDGGTGGSSAARSGIDPRFPILPSFPCILLTCRCQLPCGTVRVKGRCLPTAGSLEDHWSGWMRTERSVGCWSSPSQLTLRPARRTLGRRAREGGRSLAPKFPVFREEPKKRHEPTCSSACFRRARSACTSVASATYCASDMPGC